MIAKNVFGELLFLVLGLIVALGIYAFIDLLKKRRNRSK